MISVKNLNIEFNGKVYIENLHFTVKKGEKAVITGPSGIGKSSIFHSLLGFYVPKDAVIEIDQLNLNRLTIEDIRSKIAWLPQNINLFANTKLRDLFDKIGDYKGNRAAGYSLLEIERLFSDFNLESDLLDQDFKELSGGEKQRIGMIITLLLNRPIILLDEPGSALDKVSKQKVIDIFLNNKDLTVLSVSHDDEWIKSCTKEIKISSKKI